MLLWPLGSAARVQCWEALLWVLPPGVAATLGSLWGLNCIFTQLEGKKGLGEIADVLLHCGHLILTLCEVFAALVALGSLGPVECMAVCNAPISLLGS